MPAQAKPIHVIQQVRLITKNKLYPKIALIDYWNKNIRTEVPLYDIIKIECDCEEMIITIKSNNIRSYKKRIKKGAKNVCQS